MRKNAAAPVRAALVAGLVLVAGLAVSGHARADAPTPWLGVYMQELTPELRDGMDYRGEGGVLVSRVAGDSPAERAGVRKGDLIVRVNSRPVDSPEALADVIRAAHVGQSISVELFRDGDRRVVSVWLGARPDTGAEREGDTGPPEPATPAVPPAAPAAPAHPARPIRPVPPSPRADRDMVDRYLEGLGGPADLDLRGDATGRLGIVSRGRLGVRVESLSPALGDYFGLKDGRGALVLEVLDGSPAQQAGLLPGDVITRLEDRAVANSTDLVEGLRGKEGKVALRVVRHGAPRTIEAKLEPSGPERVRILLDRLGDRPGVQKRIIVRETDRDDLRHELDRLKEQVDELRQRLDDLQGDEGGGE